MVVTQTMRAFLNLGLSVDNAQRWIDYGFTAYEAAPWLANSFRHPYAVRRNIDAGRTLVDCGGVDGII